MVLATPVPKSPALIHVENSLRGGEAKIRTKGRVLALCQVSPRHSRFPSKVWHREQLAKQDLGEPQQVLVLLRQLLGRVRLLGRPRDRVRRRPSPLPLVRFRGKIVGECCKQLIAQRKVYLLLWKKRLRE